MPRLKNNHSDAPYGNNKILHTNKSVSLDYTHTHTHTHTQIHLLSNNRILAAHISTSMDKAGLVEIEPMHLRGVLVHLSVVLLYKSLANNGRIYM